MHLSKLFISFVYLAIPAIAADVAPRADEDPTRNLFELKPVKPTPSGDKITTADPPRDYVRGRHLAYHRLPSHGSPSSKKISVSSKSVPPPVSSKSTPKPVRPPVPPPTSSSKSWPTPVPPPPPTPWHPTPGKGKGQWPPTGKGGKGYYPPPGKGKGYYPPPGKGKGYYPPPGKGKGSMPPPGKGKGFYPPMEPVCSSFGVIFQTDDLVPRKTPSGRTFDNVPFYDGDGEGGIIGFYSENRVNLPSEDCLGTGTFSFGRNFTSQIFVQFTCNGAYTSVVGGTGDYGCAEGYLEYVLQTRIQVNALITICSALCPVPEAPPTVPTVPPPSKPAPSKPAPSKPAPSMPAPSLPVKKPTALPVKGTKAPYKYAPIHPKQ